MSRDARALLPRAQAWRISFPGRPLGKQYPPGRRIALARTHRDAWKQVIRCDVCSYCGKGGGTVDHIEPRSEKGQDGWTNYAGACRDCNIAKGTDSLLVYMLGRVERRGDDPDGGALGAGAKVGPEVTFVGFDSPPR